MLNKSELQMAPVRTVKANKKKLNYTVIVEVLFRKPAAETSQVQFPCHV